MTRSKWKSPYVKTTLLTKNTTVTETKSRNSEITPFFVGKTYKIYNGKSYIKVLVTDKMVGHKLGEFSFTRKQHFYKNT